MRSPLTIIAIAAFAILPACSKNGDGQPPATTPCVHVFRSGCQKAVVVDKDLYDNTITNNYGITSAVITGNCLEIKFSASGCSGDTWVVDLVDAKMVAESNPPQRKLRMKLANDEICTAMPAKTVTFDLTPLRLANTHSIILSLEGYSGSLTYTY